MKLDGSSQVTWFEDRPGRKADILSIADFVEVGMLHMRLPVPFAWGTLQLPKAENRVCTASPPNLYNFADI